MFAYISNPLLYLIFSAFVSNFPFFCLLLLNESICVMMGIFYGIKKLILFSSLVCLAEGKYIAEATKRNRTMLKDIDRWVGEERVRRSCEAFLIQLPHQVAQKSLCTQKTLQSKSTQPISRKISSEKLIEIDSNHFLGSIFFSESEN